MWQFSRLVILLAILEAVPLTVADAVMVAKVGQENTMLYARRVFAAVDLCVDKITDDMLLDPAYSLLPEFVRAADGRFETTGPREVTILFELMFHSGHAQRHLGMIEALKGAMFSVPGTASI